MYPKVIYLLIDFVIFQMGRANKNSLHHADRVNIGSAYLVAPGWVNLDNSPSVWLSQHSTIRQMLQKINLVKESAQQRWPKGIIFQDVRHGLPWPDQSVQYIYTSHLLEHLSRQDGERFLQECYRVMKSRGILRVVVPDLLLCARRYVDAMSKPNMKCSDFTSFSATEDFLEIVGAHSGSKISLRNPHRWMYDSCSLAQCLKRSGFIKIEQKTYREGRVPDLGILDTRPDDSLHMEAERP